MMIAGAAGCTAGVCEDVCEFNAVCAEEQGAEPEAIEKTLEECFADCEEFEKLEITLLVMIRF